MAASSTRTLSGDLGISYRNQRPVTELIAERLPATLELVIVATFLSLALGIPLGVLCALKPNGVAARLVQALSLVGISTPTFVTGIVLILVFAVSLGWLPSFGRGQVVDLGWWSTGFLTISGLKSLLLPGITLALYQLTLIMRLVRAEMIDVLSSDYIRFAKARGLPTRYIHFRLALRNALMPVITVTGLQIGSLIAFAIVTETVFQWPGMGLLFIQAVSFVDIPVMAAYLLFVGLLFVLINTSSTSSTRSSIPACARGPHENARFRSRPVRPSGRSDLGDRRRDRSPWSSSPARCWHPGSRLTIRPTLPPSS